MAKIKLRFVVQQAISGTYTYRVISPTRNNFSAVNVFSREDMWAPITADAIQANKDREAFEKIQQEEAARRVQQAEARQTIASPQVQITPEELEENAAASRILEAYKQAGVDTSDPAILTEIENQAKNAVSEHNNNLSVLGDQTQQIAFQTQGPLGAYSHAQSLKASIDISPVATGPFAGQVFVPASEEATLQFNKSSITVFDPKGESYLVAHLEVPKEVIGKKINTKDIPGYGTAQTGIYVPPLEHDPDSPKFTGPHGHFQELEATVPVSYRVSQENVNRLQTYLQREYERNHIRYTVVEPLATPTITP